MLGRMQLQIVSPTKALVKSATEEDVQRLTKLLSYTNKSNQFMLKKHYSNRWWRSKDPDGWARRLEELKNSINKSLVYGTEELYIRPGSIPYIKDEIKFDVVNKMVLPTPRKVAWAKPLPFDLHPYQQSAHEKLIAGIHTNAELCTGAGKSAIILKNCRETGFQTAVVAPGKSIFNELLDKFEEHLGRVNVGKFGDGKKTLGKRFTICIGDSLANVEPGTPEWTFFSKMQQIEVDESHLWGAESLDQVCHGVFADVPHRHFFSGTQTRNDGSEKLLQSTVGETVETLSTKEAVAGGYICPQQYRIIAIESSNPNYNSPDVLEMKRVHFLRNRNIAAFIAKLANADALKGRQSLILVEELNQIAMLLPLLKVPVAIAHSEKKADRLRELGIEKVDPKESVEKFNKAEAMVLIGTSCISTGTNIYPTHNTFNWQGGASEIMTKQGAIGRSVRLHSQNPWKDRCLIKEISTIWDFDVFDCYVLQKHLEDRMGFYKETGSEIKFISLRKTL